MSVEKKRTSKEDGPKTDLHEKVLFINRCAKVVKGGRRFSFSALVIVGDGKGKVGMGFGKANEVTDAIRKAVDDGRKSMMEFELEGDTIPHDVEAVYDGARVLIKSACHGTGVIAGSHVRSVLEMIGVKDVVAKNLGGNNPCNQVRATFKALSRLQNKSKAREARSKL
jgi:small subunit ribosomal protein S5